MRACYLLLVSATTLLFSSNAVLAATNVGHMKLSQMVTPDTIQSIEAAQVATTKRFLRINKVTDEDSEEDPEEDSEEKDSNDSTDEEERGKLNVGILDDAVETVAKSAMTDDAIVNLLKAEATTKNMKMLDKLFDGDVTVTKLNSVLKGMSRTEQQKIGAGRIKQFYGWYLKMHGGDNLAV